MGWCVDEMAEDPKKQEMGSPCYMNIDDDIAPDDVAFFNIIRANTPEYNKQIEEIRRDIYGFSHVAVDNTLISAVWLAEYGCTGWDNIIDKNGNDIKFSRQSCKSIFANPELRLSLVPVLMLFAANYNNYLYDDAREDAEAVKKS